MSRRLGRVEARILATLSATPGKVSALELAAVVYDLQPNADGVVVVSENQATAVRHALSNLRKQGKVFHLGRFYRGEPRSGESPVGMWASKAAAREWVKKTVAAFGQTNVDPDLLLLLDETT